jgi:hypothetical protein
VIVAEGHGAPEGEAGQAGEQQAPGGQGAGIGGFSGGEGGWRGLGEGGPLQEGEGEEGDEDDGGGGGAEADLAGAKMILHKSARMDTSVLMLEQENWTRGWRLSDRMEGRCWGLRGRG